MQKEPVKKKVKAKTVKKKVKVPSPPVKKKVKVPSPPVKKVPVEPVKKKNNKSKIIVVHEASKNEYDKCYDIKINKVINQLKEQNKSFDSKLRFGWQNN